MDDCEIAAKKLDKLILAHKIEPIITPIVCPENPNTGWLAAHYKVNIRGHIVDYSMGLGHFDIEDFRKALRLAKRSFPAKDIDAVMHEYDNAHRIKKHSDMYIEVVGYLAQTKSVTALEVISTVLRDAYNCDIPFESWAQEMGYDEDSREAFKVWEACNANRRSAREWFGDDLQLAIDYAIAM